MTFFFKKNYLFICLFIISSSLFSQVGIGTNSPKATLHIEVKNPADPSENDGLIIPRVDQLPSTNPTEEGLILYLKNATDNGFYFWKNDKWNKVMSHEQSVDIPTSVLYDENTTTKYLISDIPADKNIAFELSFFVNCGSRKATVKGVINNNQTISVSELLSFRRNGLTNDPSRISKNHTFDVRLGLETSTNVRLVTENNKLYWIADNGWCNGKFKLTSGKIYYPSDSGVFSNGTGGESIWERKNSNIFFSSGKVGIGTSYPQQALDVAGNIHFSGTLSNLSDKRMKKNITDFYGGLTQVNKLRPVTYQYNGKYGNLNTSEYHIGLIAQEAEKIAPYLIKEIKRPKDLTLKAVKYNDIILMLVNSVKELSAKVDQLEQQLNTK